MIYIEGVIAGPDGHLYAIDIDHSVVMSMTAFYDVLKENTSIEDFSLGLYPQEDPVFDLGYFFSNNKSLKALAIYSDWL